MINNLIFRTLDGVNIYEGDVFWWVNINSVHPLWEHTCKKRTQQGKYKAFSRKENAIKYLLLNSSNISIDNLINIYEFKVNNNIRIGD